MLIGSWFSVETKVKRGARALRLAWKVQTAQKIASNDCAFQRIWNGYEKGTDKTEDNIKLYVNDHNDNNDNFCEERKSIL